MTEAHLGDIIGEFPAPMRPVYLRPRQARCFVQRGVHVVLATTAAVVYGGVIALHVVMSFLLSPIHSIFLGD